MSAHLRTVFPDAELRVVDDGGEPFARGNSLNQAFDGLDPDTVVVACDADLIVPIEQLHQAVEQAATPGMAIPFNELIYVNADGSTQRWPWAPTMPMLGGCNVLTVRSWAEAGGWLPGFRAWGCEDVAMANQVGTLVGPVTRLTGTATHLYHPKAKSYTDPKHVALNSVLMIEVGAACGDVAAMRQIVGAP